MPLQVGRLVPKELLDRMVHASVFQKKAPSSRCSLGHPAVQGCIVIAARQIRSVRDGTTQAIMKEGLCRSCTLEA